MLGTCIVLAAITVILSPQLRNRMIRETRHLVKMYRDNQREIQPAPKQPRPATWSDDRLTAAWIGHATMLINFYGVWILTDPIFSDQAGPNFGPFAIGPKRYIAPALTMDELPKIDLIILSHAHFDHMDMRSLAKLAKLHPQAKVVTAAKTSDLLNGKKFSRIEELAWQQSTAFEFRQGPLTVTALQVKHWGARWRRDTYRGFNGYLLEYNGRRICFSGDTAYMPHFAPLAKGGLDLMFIGIGAYDPWIANHCNPEEASLMANQAGARHVFPMHFATFKLSNEPMDEPLRRFKQAIESQRIAGEQIGDTFVLP